MTTTAQALTELGIKDWVLRGEPTTEEQFATMFRKVIGINSHGNAIESSNPKDWGTTWEKVSAEKKKLVDGEPMRLLRVERNRLLAETDWMVNSDVASISDAWKKYRQELRDITKSASPKLGDDRNLDMSSVTFPTKPS